MASYQVIARKYRPQCFADVVGQEHVTQTLSNAIKQNRIAHAYLFVGPRGTGKTTIARIFAKCLNCTGGPKADFPADDPRAKEITEGRSLDVLEIDGASNRGIEEIRELRDTVKYAPSTSKFKIFIIDEVHMLTKEAFNALLKTLEEPPEHVKFMFATTEPEKVLPTVLSRCQRFDLRRIPTNLIVKHLAQISAQEGVTIDDAALQAIARGAEGGMRDAESTLDQLISFCGNQIVETDVLSMFGLAARSQILNLGQAILEGQVHRVLQELNDLASNGKDLGRLLSDLLNHFRNLMVFQVTQGDLRLLEVSEAEASALKTQATLAGSESVTRIMEILSDCETRLRDSASKKIMIEVALLRCLQARHAISLDSVLVRLNELKQSQPSASSVAVAVPVVESRAIQAIATPSVEAAAVVPNIGATELVGVALQALWTNLFEGIGRANPFAKGYFEKAFLVSYQRKTLTIGFGLESADQLAIVDNVKNVNIIKTRLGELGYPNSSVKFVQAECPLNFQRPIAAVVAPVDLPPWQPASVLGVPSKEARVVASEVKGEKVTPVLLNKEDFKNDPLIKKALEIFKGQIVEVRA
ncbi:MAG: DNA polymerase III subunit gamma/tau [Verrucomicrobia bacterium]|nr:DNA polymerase III subunit gamma/tau [Verrucomicrobiota bacterium]